MYQEAVESLNKGLPWAVMSPVITTYVIDWMKQSDSKWFSWIGSHAPNTTRIVSLVLAGFQAAGFSWISDIADHGTLTITGLTLVNLGTFIKYLFSNVIIQKGAYMIKTTKSVGVATNIRTAKTAAVILAVDKDKENEPTRSN